MKALLATAAVVVAVSAYAVGYIHGSDAYKRACAQHEDAALLEQRRFYLLQMELAARGRMSAVPVEAHKGWTCGLDDK